MSMTSDKASRRAYILAEADKMQVKGISRFSALFTAARFTKFRDPLARFVSDLNCHLAAQGLAGF